LGIIVKVRAAHGSNGAVAILEDGFEIPFRCLRKVSMRGDIITKKETDGGPDYPSHYTTGKEVI